MPMLVVCICTHSPRPTILRRCLEAIETQLSPPAFRVLLIDNASQPPLPESLLDGLRQRGVPASLIREQRLGITAARLTAFDQATEEWLVFIDDDNVVDPSFLKLGAEFAGAHPEVGAFGGRICLAPEIKVPEWMIPLLGSMGVKEEGDNILIDSTIEWGRHDPPGAGLWVRRAILKRFADRTRSNPAVFELGRRGNSLASCEDAVMVKGARELGYYNAYVPTLRTFHYLKPERFTFRHAIRSLIGYGRSIALYEEIMSLTGEQLGRSDKASPLLSGWKAFNRQRRRSIRYAATQAVYQWSYERSHQAFERVRPDFDPNAETLRNLLPFVRTSASVHLDQSTIVVTEGMAEFVVYGPYWTLPAGDYEMRALIKPDQNRSVVSSPITAQVTGKLGTRLIAEGKWWLNHPNQATPAEFRLPFSLTDDLPRPARTIEARIFSPGNLSFRIFSLSLIAMSGSRESGAPAN